MFSQHTPIPDNRRRDEGAGETIRRRRADVRRLHRALVTSLVSATRDGDVFLMNLIGGALGGLAKARVIESLDENTPLVEEQEVAALLCETVYLFERSCAELKDTRNPSQDPVATIIWNKTRGEDLAKIVIENGLNFLVNPGSRNSVGVRHVQTPYRYFYLKLKDALEKAQIEPPRDIRARVRELLGGALPAHPPYVAGAAAPRY